MKHVYKETSSNDTNDDDAVVSISSPMHDEEHEQAATHAPNSATDFGSNEYISKDYDVNFAQSEGIDRYNVDVDKAELYSWFVNIFLLIAKLYIGIVSNSKAVWASVADSIVDLLSQAVLSIATRYIRLHDPDYPVGRSRLEALSVLASAGIMTMASIEVIQFSCIDLVDGIEGQIPRLDISTEMYLVLSVGIFLKMLLYIYCSYVNKIADSDALEALAEDHLNDIMSNTAALVASSIAFHAKGGWWVDPIGAILISLAIIYRWIFLMKDQVKKVVGFTAPPEFILSIESIAKSHDKRLLVDCTRAYYFGARFNVEMEIVLPGDMTVAISHDIALALQHKIEALKDVERAFVHVDYLTRDGLEHKIERELVLSFQKSREAANTASPSTHSSFEMSMTDTSIGGSNDNTSANLGLAHRSRSSNANLQNNV